MKFKVGDKVKLKDHVCFSCRGKILTIIDLDCGYKYIPVTWVGMSRSYFPLLPNEIEPLIKVGQQLLFSFMEQS